MKSIVYEVKHNFSSVINPWTISDKKVIKLRTSLIGVHSVPGMPQHFRNENTLPGNKLGIEKACLKTLRLPENNAQYC